MKDFGISRRDSLKFVILLGVVSLFADATYEGARSIAGPYLAVLGASAAIVGIVLGLGELVGYGLRSLFGYISDRTGKYWTMTILGYALNLLAVPLLALAGRWEIAAFLMIAERMGKAIRTPARDAMLSHATARLLYPPVHAISRLAKSDREERAFRSTVRSGLRAGKRPSGWAST